MKREAAERTTPVPTLTIPDLLTIEELSDYLLVPVATLRRWRYERTGPRAVKLGRHVRYRRADVEKWLDQAERAQ